MSHQLSSMQYMYGRYRQKYQYQFLSSKFEQFKDFDILKPNILQNMRITDGYVQLIHCLRLFGLLWISKLSNHWIFSVMKQQYNRQECFVTMHATYMYVSGRHILHHCLFQELKIVVSQPLDGIIPLSKVNMDCISKRSQTNSM